MWTPIIAAPFVGSFLGVLIRDLPEERVMRRSRSNCASCGTVLGWADLVPVASYLCSRGRCRHCDARIGVFHLAIELAAVAVAVSAAVTAFDVAEAWMGCALGWTLLALAWIDAEHLYLPDALTLPLVLAGLGATWWLDPTAVLDHAAAAVFGYAALRLVGSAYQWARGREGLGQGDAKLFAASGAWLGIAWLPWVLLLAALLGLAVSAPALLRDPRHANQLKIPFGPQLALATWVAWLLT